MRLTMLIRKIEYSAVNKSSTFYLIFPAGCRRRGDGDASNVAAGACRTGQHL
jgi:hypothetical protein